MTPQQTMAQRLSAWSASLSLNAVPDPVRAEARRCLLDTLGVILAGRRSAVTEAVARYAEELGPGPCWSAATGAGLAPTAAALVNGTAGHAWDFDDTSYSGVMHGSVVVLPAVLALAQVRSLTGAALLEALVAGLEVDYAVALLATRHHYEKGWWSSGSFGVFGAAAGAARALALDPERTAQALGLAGSQAMGLRAALGSDAKPYLAGRAAASGLEAALLAAEGVAGPADVLESPRGFLSVMNDGRCDEGALAALGQRWCLLDPGIFFKPYPALLGGPRGGRALCAPSGRAGPERRGGDEDRVPRAALGPRLDDPRPAAEPARSAVLPALRRRLRSPARRYRAVPSRRGIARGPQPFGP